VVVAILLLALLTGLVLLSAACEQQEMAEVQDRARSTSTVTLTPTVTSTPTVTPTPTITPTPTATATPTPTPQYVNRELFIPAVGFTTGLVKETGGLSSYALEDKLNRYGNFGIKVPEDFVSVISVKAVWQCPSSDDGGEGMRWKLYAEYSAAGEAVGTHTSSPAYGCTEPSDTVGAFNVQEPQYPLALSALAGEDYLGIRMTRDGNHSDDDIGDWVYVVGLLFAYVAQQ